MRVAWLLLAFSLSVAAQPITEADAARARFLLSSPQWKDKAWGAYYAGRLHSPDVEQPLLNALREAAALRGAAWQTEEYGYMTALLDAAIESGTRVPAEVLRPFEEKWPDAVVVLLARAQDREESLLRMRERELSEGQWLAVNNLLLALKSRRLFARTLSEVEISHRFIVTDPGNLDGIGRDGGGGRCDDGAIALPMGFPPAGVYELLDARQPSDLLLAAGPENAYYRRIVAPIGKYVGVGSCGPYPHRNSLRIGYLAALTEVAGLLQLFRASTRIEYRDEADLQQRFEKALASQEAAVRAFVRAAQEKGFGNVTGMKLEIVPEIEDIRKTPSGRTPSRNPREFVLD